MKMRVNNKILFILSIICFWLQSIAAQSFVESSTGGWFLKKAEYNFLSPGWYNLQSKTELEMLFFGDFNAELEFFVEPSFEGAYGFRIVRDSSGVSKLLEIKRINNYDEVHSQLSEEYPSIGIPVEEWFSISEEKSEQISQHNSAMYEKQRKESLIRYRIDTQCLSAGNDLSEKLYAEVSNAIYHFKGKGVPVLILDGNTVTFRCVVEDEVWTLTVHEPEGEIKQLTDICNRIVKDAETDNLNKK